MPSRWMLIAGLYARCGRLRSSSARQEGVGRLRPGVRASRCLRSRSGRCPVEGLHMTIPFPPAGHSASGSTSGGQAGMARRPRRARGSRRDRVVLRGKIRNSGRSLSSPRQPSLRRAVRDAKVKESLSSLFVLPRAPGRQGCRGCAPVAVGPPFVAHRLSERDGRELSFRAAPFRPRRWTTPFILLCPPFTASTIS